MRPKIVILTLVIAVGLIGVIVVLKGLTGNGTQVVPVEESNGPAPAVTNIQVNPGSNNTAPVSEEARAAQKEKEMDEVRDAIATGTVDQQATENILLDKMTSPDPEVRKAALEALVQLNATNTIPRLQQLAQILEDPHDKAAVLDAIAYLQLPDTTTTNELSAADSMPGPRRGLRTPASSGQANPPKRSVFGHRQGQGVTPSGSQPAAPDQTTSGQAQPTATDPNSPPPQ
jgi:hypothetical protein